MQEPTLLTRNQRFAQDVYTHIQPIANQDQAYRDRYGAMALKLPILIRTAGLAQALAFVEARGGASTVDSPYHQLLSDLARVLGMPQRDNLLVRARQADMRTYIHLTRQVLAALIWFRRYAQSVLHVEPGTDVEERDDA